MFDSFHELLEAGLTTNVFEERIFFSKESVIDKTVSLQLKEGYWEIVKKDIKQAIELHGPLTDNYWRFVRERAINTNAIIIVTLSWRATEGSVAISSEQKGSPRRFAPRDDKGIIAFVLVIGWSGAGKRFLT